jgi:hypothetical protein
MRIHERLAAAGSLQVVQGDEKSHVVAHDPFLFRRNVRVQFDLRVTKE